MELEPAGTEFEVLDDPRPRILPPLPVQFVAIADVNLPAVAGLEKQLDQFYVRLLRLERDNENIQIGREIIYRAENFRLRLTIHELPPRREDFRPLAVTVPSLHEIADRAAEAELEFTRQRGIFAGNESLIFIDPAGNFVEVMESRPVG